MIFVGRDPPYIAQTDQNWSHLLKSTFIFIYSSLRGLHVKISIFFSGPIKRLHENLFFLADLLRIYLKSKLPPLFPSTTFQNFSSLSSLTSSPLLSHSLAGNGGSRRGAPRWAVAGATHGGRRQLARRTAVGVCATTVGGNWRSAQQWAQRTTAAGGGRQLARHTAAAAGGEPCDNSGGQHLGCGARQWWQPAQASSVTGSARDDRQCAGSADGAGRIRLRWPCQH